jgi:arylsulfatase A-like enzyme
MITASLLLVLVLVKAIALAQRDLHLSWWFPVAYFWHDAAVVLVFGAVAALLRLNARVVWLTYGMLAIYAVFNIPVTRVLSTPLTWPMLRATGGPLADSILHYATWQNLLLVAVMLAVCMIAPLSLRGVRNGPVLALTLALVVLGPLTASRVETNGLERNAWTALIGSALNRVQGHAAAGEWRSVSGTAPAAPLAQFRSAGAGRNLILISLESTGAQYLGLYGATPDVMPNLSHLASSGLVFEDAYAVYPESIKGLFTMLCSIYPAFDTPVEKMARAPCLSVAALLADRGYRTALFHSGRFMYLGMESVIRDRGFHTLADAGHIGGNHNSSFGVDEPATVARMLEWVDSLRQGQNFFLTYLPIAGHHPYETPEPGPDSDREEFGRYRNALRYGDASLGTLIEGLRKRGLYENTVWVVVGDHGEAFGQHDGNYGHTFHVYEENLRVPFVIAIPGWNKQVRSRPVVSLIDLAPTVLDVMGINAPAGYQGRTALAGEPLPALFFADYSQAFTGLRDGRWKFIHEPGSGRSRLFDLQLDPGERTNVAPAHEDRVRRYREVLQGWSAGQKHLLQGFTQPSDGTEVRAR